MEDTGMIVPLSDWCCEARQQAKAWLDEGLDFGRLSVNLSPSEIRRAAWWNVWPACLQETGLPPTTRSWKSPKAA